MNDSANTRPSLLVRLRDVGDDRSWSEFVDLYGPLVYRFAQSKGLQNADAADLVQEVMRRITAKMPSFAYDPARSGFRSWLFKLSRNEMIRAAGRRARPGRGAGGTDAMIGIASVPDEETDARRWDEEYERYLIGCALRRIRGEFEATTWEAFRLTAIEGRRAAEVAETLNLTLAVVYNAKSRVQKRLKAVIDEIRCD